MKSANPQHNLTEMLHVLGEQTGMKLSCIKPRQKSEVYLYSGGSRGDLRVPWNPPFQSRLCTDTVARLQLASSN